MHRSAYNLLVIVPLVMRMGAEPVQTPPSARAIEKAPYVLPAGPVASAFAPVLTPQKSAAPTVPDDLGGAGKAPGYVAGAWREPATWDAWAKILRSEAAAPTPDAERRARLCLLALDQERFEDAWQHARRSSDAWRAALLPRFLPGVPARAPLTSDGRAFALADGVELAPSLPPATSSSNTGRVDVRKMNVADVAVGTGHISMQVAVEPEGVQIEIAHVGGDAVHVAIRLPTDERYAYENEYVDWYRQDKTGIAHPLEVRPGEEPHVIYGRFTPRAVEHPTRLPDAPPAQLSRGTLWIRCASDETVLCTALAKSLEQGPLALKTELVGPGADPTSPSGILFDLTNAAERARKLAWLTSAIEHLALARP